MFVSPVWKIHILVKISCLSLEKMYICDMLKKTFLTSIGGFLEDPRAQTISGIAELSNFQHVPHFIAELSSNCSQTYRLLLWTREVVRGGPGGHAPPPLPPFYLASKFQEKQLPVVTNLSLTIPALLAYQHKMKNHKIPILCS